MNSNRGLTLGTVLACMAALTVILFAAISAAFSHLNFAQTTTIEAHAKNLADGAISKAIDRLIDSDFALGADGTGGVTYTMPGLDDAEGTLSFVASGPFSNRRSTNNLHTDDQVSGGLAREVPGRTLHLLARGRVGHTVRWVECLFYRPPFPDGLLATGPIDAKAVHLVGVRGEGDYAGGDLNSISPEDRLPGNLFSNSLSGFSPGNPSAEVTMSSRITGSVGARGSVNVDGSTTVEGELLPGSNERPLPELDIRQKIALLEPNAIALSANHTNLSLDPSWFSISNSGVTVSGDLELEGSALLVRGDLEVGGAITGTGVVLVDGDVTIGDGGSSVVGEDQVALGCTGSFDLDAAAPENNYFKGLVYCEGDMTARDITVVGASVVNGKNGSAGSARLENVRYVYNPGAVELVVQPPAGVEHDNHTLAIGFTLRPSMTPGEYVCDARAYFGFGDDCGEPEYINSPVRWPELDSTNGSIPDGTNGGTPGNWYKEFQGVPIGAPGQANFGEDLSAQIGAWADTTEEMGDPREINWNEATSDFLVPLLERAIREADHSQRLSFNLNTLLPESAGTSRILYWRPLP